MTNGYYNIQPVEVKVGSMTASAVKATFGTAYQPFAESMPFSWAIYSVDNALLYQGQGMVDQAQLALWGDNDDYIVNVMASIAGLVVIW